MGDRKRSMGAKAQTAQPVKTLLSLITAGLTAVGAPLAAQDDTGTSSSWLVRLPDGEVKRKFILDLHRLSSVR